MAQDISDLLLRVNSQQATASLNRFNSRLQQTSRSATSLLQTLAAGFTVKKSLDVISLFNKSLLDVRANARGFGIIFQNSLDIASNGISKLTKQFNHSERSAQQAMNAIGGRIASLGFSDSEIAQYSAKIRMIAEDTAAFWNYKYDVNTVTEKIVKGLQGETEGLRDLGVSLKATDESFKKLIQQQMKSKGVSEETAKAYAGMEQILKRLSYTQGAFNAQSDSINQNISDIKNNFIDIFAKAGDFFEILNQATGFLSKISILTGKQTFQKIAGITIAVSSLTLSIGGTFIVLRKLFGNVALSAVHSMENVFYRLTHAANSTEEALRRINISNRNIVAFSRAADKFSGSNDPRLQFIRAGFKTRAQYEYMQARRQQMKLDRIARTTGRSIGNLFNTLSQSIFIASSTYLGYKLSDKISKTLGSSFQNIQIPVTILSATLSMALANSLGSMFSSVFTSLGAAIAGTTFFRIARVTLLRTIPSMIAGAFVWAFSAISITAAAGYAIGRIGGQYISQIILNGVEGSFERANETIGQYVFGKWTTKPAMKKAEADVAALEKKFADQRAKLTSLQTENRNELDKIYFQEVLSPLEILDEVYTNAFSKFVDIKLSLEKLTKLQSQQTNLVKKTELQEAIKSKLVQYKKVEEEFSKIQQTFYDALKKRTQQTISLEKSFRSIYTNLFKGVNFKFNEERGGILHSIDMLFAERKSKNDQLKKFLEDTVTSIWIDKKFNWTTQQKSKFQNFAIELYNLDASLKKLTDNDKIPVLQRMMQLVGEVNSMRIDALNKEKEATSVWRQKIISVMDTLIGFKFRGTNAIQANTVQAAKLRASSTQTSLPIASLKEANKNSERIQNGILNETRRSAKIMQDIYGQIKRLAKDGSSKITFTLVTAI